jgi:chemotaxis protein methyltransferase CheR
MVDALTTNKTSFFREHSHFDFLRDTVLPACPGPCACGAPAARGGGAVHAGHAAARIVRSRRAVVRAFSPPTSVIACWPRRRRVVPAETLADVPRGLAAEVLAPASGPGGVRASRPCPRCAAWCSSAKLNLMERWPMRGTVRRDSLPQRDDLLRQGHAAAARGALLALLRPGGYLFVGHSESLTGLSHRSYVQPAVYVLVRWAVAALAQASRRGGDRIVGVADVQVSNDVRRAPHHVRARQLPRHCGARSGGRCGRAAARDAAHGRHRSGQDAGQAGHVRGRASHSCSRSATSLGAKKERMIVKVAGGAHAGANEADDRFQIGKRNMIALRKLLWKNGVMVHAQETGGVQTSRTMWLDVGPERSRSRSTASNPSSDPPNHGIQRSCGRRQRRHARDDRPHAQDERRPARVVHEAGNGEEGLRLRRSGSICCCSTSTCP